MANLLNEIGVVVIGRNEGKRLKGCLQSVLRQVDNRVVYVDSGSTDASVEYAESVHVDVVQLDMKIPFSAGRARNAGFRLLNEKYKKLKWIQFLDGDCELLEGWLSFALAYLEVNKTYAIVAGRRFEKFPEASVYNLLCDLEWNTPVGETESCGGDFMIRKEAFLQTNGFNPTVIAGEEPDLCYRLRKKNWLVVRLDHAMTLHDAAIMRFSQWWRRAIRSGHAYAQGYVLHAQDGRGYCLMDSLKTWLWALFFPLSVLLLALTVNLNIFLFYTAYLLQFAKITRYAYRRFGKLKHAIIYSIFTVIAKWPQFIGQLIFLRRKILGKEYLIIEYG